MPRRIEAAAQAMTGSVIDSGASSMRMVFPQNKRIDDGEEVDRIQECAGQEYEKKDKLSRLESSSAEVPLADKA